MVWIIRAMTVLLGRNYVRAIGAIGAIRFIVLTHQHCPLLNPQIPGLLHPTPCEEEEREGEEVSAFR